MTAKRGRGRVALPPGEKRRVKVSPHFTESEAARLDAVRGDVERAAFVREAVMEKVDMSDASLAVGAWSHPDDSEDGAQRRRSRRGGVVAYVSDALGWDAWPIAPGPRLGAGPETGREGRRLADAALRAAGYVLADGGEA